MYIFLAANVMIHEEGRLQIIDFGVAGTLVNQEDKRTTVIGTPHWMGPEVFKGKDGKDKGYGTKVRNLFLSSGKLPCGLGNAKCLGRPIHGHMAARYGKWQPAVHQDQILI